MSIKADALNRLFDAYGKPVTAQRMYYYEQWASELEADEVSRMVDQVVKSESYLPTVSKLYDLSRISKSRGTTQPNTYYCEKCEHAFIVRGGICPECGRKGIQ